MKLSIGFRDKVDGYVTKRITDEELLTLKASKVAIYLDSESNGRFMDYYKSVRQLLRLDNKVLILINQDDQSDISHVITQLCLQYDCFNIYKVYNDTVIDKDYIDDLFKRKSSADEVEMFISKEDAAYDTITEAMIKITQLCLDGHLDDLQDYITINRDMIRKYPVVLDYMKETISQVNSGVTAKIAKLEKEIAIALEGSKELENQKSKLVLANTDLETTVQQQTRDIAKKEHELEVHRETIGKLQIELEEANNEANSLSTMSKNLGLDGEETRFDNYKERKLTTIKGNKLKTVLYFKEISRPTYINTMIIQLLNYLKDKNAKTKGKVKLVIFDNREDFVALYNPVKTANTATYFSNKSDILAQEVILFTDANPAYLEDLAKIQGIEFLIIYDRFGKKEDFLIGDAVIKFYTFASSSDVMRYREIYQMLSMGNVITNKSGTKPISGVLEIADLGDNFGALPPPSQFGKYFKMLASGNSAETLFNTIIKKCGI